MPEPDVRQLAHDARHADPEAAIHQARAGTVFGDDQPGTADFNRSHLVGSAAPEPRIERWGPVGPEGFGAVEILDGRTGRPLARLNGRARRRLEG